MKALIAISLLLASCASTPGPVQPFRAIYVDGPVHVAISGTVFDADGNSLSGVGIYVWHLQDWDDDADVDLRDVAIYMRQPYPCPWWVVVEQMTGPLPERSRHKNAMGGPGG